MNILYVKEKIKEKLLRQIENLSEEEFQKIDNNTHEIKIKIEKIRKKKIPKSELTDDEMKRLEKELSNLITREGGIELLSFILKDKLSAEQFAKFMRVSFLKQDNKDYIINKIVEATIGAKLRSYAIKGQ
jgi:Glu-tRNA(Gln) amidotransferase subunit E-like FAD-binding protein